MDQPKPPDLRALAQAYTTEALETLATLMRKGESETAQIAAARELLDRGHGKPKSESGTTGLSLEELIEQAAKGEG